MLVMLRSFIITLSIGLAADEKVYAKSEEGTSLDRTPDPSPQRRWLQMLTDTIIPLDPDVTGCDDGVNTPVKSTLDAVGASWDAASKSVCKKLGWQRLPWERQNQKSRGRVKNVPN